MTQPNPDRDPIQRVLNDGGNEAIPPEITARARRQLDALRERMEERAIMNQEKRINGIFTNWRRTLAWATPVAALVMLAVLGVMITSQIQNQKVYAQVVRRIREAQTMLISLTTRMEGSPDMKMEVGFKDNGLVRIDMAGGVRSFMDSKAMKSITFDPVHKVVVENTLTNMPEMKGSRDPAKEIERLRRLPERASAELGEKTVAGRQLRGYRVEENDEVDEVWIDADTRELVQIDANSKAFPGIKIAMTNFRFDPELPSGYFDTSVPAGYTRQTFNLDLGNASVDDILVLLASLVELSPDGTFPPSMNPLELQKLVQQASKRPKPKGPRTEAMKKLRPSNPAEAMKQAQSTARGMVFLLSMKPEHDWHYIGQGVKYGEPKTPIAWFRPSGSKTYKVIYADLTVKEEAPEAVPTPAPAKAGAGPAK